jgi:hypothetical protein
LAVIVGLDAGSGVQVIDARRLLALGYQPDPRLPVVILCPSYLVADDCPPAALATALGMMREHLLLRYPPWNTVHHVRFNDANPTEATVNALRLGELARFAGCIDAASSLLIPPSNGPT